MTTIKIWPYCQAMTRLHYAPVRPTREKAIDIVIKTISTNSPIIISGTHHHAFEANTVIGKSELFHSTKWQAYLRAGELKAHHHNNHHGSRIDYQPEQIPDDCEVYIFYEIHHFFPRRDSLPRKEALMTFWEKVAGLIQAGKRVIFITALHPQSLCYRDFLGMGDFFAQYRNSPALAVIRGFFFAPVIELPARF